jgi:hypothetical protein
VLSVGEPVVEIRFYQAGRAPQRPVFEAFLGWDYLENKFGASTTAIVNGRFVNVDYKQVNELLDFVSYYKVFRRNKLCEANEDK